MDFRSGQRMANSLDDVAQDVMVRNSPKIEDVREHYMVLSVVL